jgi:hypothetical protein
VAYLEELNEALGNIDRQSDAPACLQHGDHQIMQQDQANAVWSHVWSGMKKSITKTGCEVRCIDGARWRWCLLL